MLPVIPEYLPRSVHARSIGALVLNRNFSAAKDSLHYIGMPGWTVTESHPPNQNGCTFQRPLGSTELAFFWEARSMNGTTDGLHHVELRLLDTSKDQHLFSDANIINAWLSTKRRYPLAGATIQMLQEGECGDSTVTSTLVPYFVVRESDLAILRPNEIVFEQVARGDEVRRRITSIWDNPRPLSDELLAQLYVFREVGSQALHLGTLIAHYVTDGTANRTLLRCLLDTLSRGGGTCTEPAQVPLDERLAMMIPPSDLEPLHLRLLSPARQRWRRAIGGVIHRMRMAKAKAPGGYTLPCRLTRTTPHVPARPGFVSALLAEAQTTTVIADCRLNGLTFGSAYLALAQVAMTRVLYRRYLRGEISEEEWEYRKRQRYQTFGPLNLRPYLDKAWFERGGGGEFMTSISTFSYKLPYMTLGGTERRQYNGHKLFDGAPPFRDLLTFERFMYRAGLVKKQAKAFFEHPLFLEFVRVTSLIVARRMQKQAEAINDPSTHSNDDNQVLAVTDMGLVSAHGGASLGNLDLIFPTEYPLPASHPLSPFSSAVHPSKAGYVTLSPAMKVDTSTKIVVENAEFHLHVRPAELYLGALTLRGRLNMWVAYDRNVYEEEVVKEWLDEVKGAVVWYLGQTHPRQALSPATSASCRCQGSVSDGHPV